ncbi:M12 family metallo-peptidase [Flavobacteriaceae bacterium]|nr:M12 family metallo-peptidase [Flavobacteriaceae bacterium]
MIRNLLVFLLVFCGLNAVAQERGLWVLTPEEAVNITDYSKSHETPREYNTYKLNKTPEYFLKSQSIELPHPDGGIAIFDLEIHQVLGPELSLKYPMIKSFKGVNRKNKEETVYLSLGKDGFFGMVLSPKFGQYFIDPVSKNNDAFLIYTKADLPSSQVDFSCYAGKEGHSEADEHNDEQSSKSLESLTNQGKLREFRLAIATTGEYSQFHLNNQDVPTLSSDAEKKAAVLSAINTTMTRVNGIFERDVALTMQLISNNDEIIYLDPNTDPFTNFDAGELIQESQTVIDDVIGFDNYDIGHTFSTGGGGLAYLSSPCTSTKAQGITGSTFPIGDAYDVDYVSHEMGHQFGATHTFNGDAGSCDGNRTNSTAVEPGSGTTIMSYAGICGSQNVQNLADSYFHTVSIIQMIDNIYEGNSICGTTTPIANQAPIIEAGASVTIPISTPFILEGEANDLDEDVLLFVWEQIDTEITEAPPVSTAVGGPVFRSMSPSTNRHRFFPDLETVLQGSVSNKWEVVPSVSRSMNFAFTARDGFQNSTDTRTVNVSSQGGPFKISNLNSDVEALQGGSSIEILWDVASTDLMPIGATYVDLYFSSNPTEIGFELLKSEIPNTGSATIMIPNIETAQGRFMLKGHNNVFYDLNDQNLTVVENEIALNFDSLSQTLCVPNSAVYTIAYSSAVGFDERVDFSLNGAPESAVVDISPAFYEAGETGEIILTVSDIDENMIGSYEMSFQATSSTSTQEVNISLEILGVEIPGPVLVSPLNDVTDQGLELLFEWEGISGASSYYFELSKTESFNDVLVAHNSINTNYMVSDLEANTTYFWRVKAETACGSGNYSEVFSLNTADIRNATVDYLGPNQTIPDNNPLGLSVNFDFSEQAQVIDVNVGLTVSHTYIGDLQVSLIAPSGKEVILKYIDSGNGSNDFEGTVFDDDAEMSIIMGSAPYVGAFKPQEPLLLMNGEFADGIWVLKIIDGGPADVGTFIDGFLEITGLINEDIDGDGVPNEIDNCPGIVNPDQLDADMDGIGDLCDDDWDNDGVVNSLDNCLNTPNPDQNDFDFDGIGDLCDDDLDGDLVIDTEDNCPNTFNPDQIDVDGDGIGDTCDSEIELDKIIPTGISPNGDGLNDFWDLGDLSKVYPKLEVYIYDSGGKLFYQSDNYENNWAGERNIGSTGLLPVGSYFYRIVSDQAILANFPEPYEQTGWVYLNY